MLLGTCAAAGTAVASDCGYASIDQGGASSGGNIAVAGDGDCWAGPTHRPKPPPPAPPNSCDVHVQDRLVDRGVV
ncbi:hypothetical protein ABZ383_26170, partial [Streptomyces sp. NPDC005900]